MAAKKREKDVLVSRCACFFFFKMSLSYKFGQGHFPTENKSAHPVYKKKLLQHYLMSDNILPPFEIMIQIFQYVPNHGRNWPNISLTCRYFYDISKKCLDYGSVLYEAITMPDKFAEPDLVVHHLVSSYKIDDEKVNYVRLVVSHSKFGSMLRSLLKYGNVHEFDYYEHSILYAVKQSNLNLLASLLLHVIDCPFEILRYIACKALRRGDWIILLIVLKHVGFQTCPSYTFQQLCRMAKKNPRCLELLDKFRKRNLPTQNTAKRQKTENVIDLTK